jgi:hypothetical protein
MRWSEDALSWSTIANPPSQATNALSRFAATNSRSDTNVFIAWRHNDRRIGVSKFVQGGSWSFVRYLPHRGLYDVGIASKSNGDMLVAHQVHHFLQTGSHEVKVTQSSNGFVSFNWPVTYSNAANASPAPGVTATYDPNSGQYIVMWRRGIMTPTGMLDSQGNQIIYRLSGGGSPQLLPYSVSDTPSISCAPTSVVPGNNCLLSYMSDQDWGGPVRWRQCQVVGGSLSCGSEKSHGYYSVGTASVAYSGPFWPWHIALIQGGNGVYTWRKPQAETQNFQDQRSFGLSPQAILPASGSAYYTPSNNRRYVFSMREN